MGATKLKPVFRKLDLATPVETPETGSTPVEVPSAPVAHLSPRIPPMPKSIPAGMRSEYRELMRGLLLSATWNAQQLPLVECYLLAVHTARTRADDALHMRARAQVLAYAQALGIATRTPQLLRGMPAPAAPPAPAPASAKPPASRWS